MTIKIKLNGTDSLTKIFVECNDKVSHQIDLSNEVTRFNDIKIPSAIYQQPIEFGNHLYDLLFPPDTLASQQLLSLAQPTSISLATTIPELDSISWEFLHNRDFFLVQKHHFFRKPLLSTSNKSVLNSTETNLRIFAVPSKPITDVLKMINVEQEWHNLVDSIRPLQNSIILERVPPTLLEIRNRIMLYSNSVFHFMGHGLRDKDGHIKIVIELSNGTPDYISAEEISTSIKNHVQIAVLNSCASASTDSTYFTSFAKSLVEMGIPYAIGMSYNIFDEDALMFSKTLYNELSRSSSLLEAVRQARFQLVRYGSPWSIGLPVLYASSDAEDEPIRFTGKSLPTVIVEPLAKRDITDLPKEPNFQGRKAQLIEIGDILTGNASLIVIQGVGGQGKTTLAREVVEHFGYKFHSGVWALSLKTIPRFRSILASFANFLDIDVSGIRQHIHDRVSEVELPYVEDYVEKQLRSDVIGYCESHRLLVVLDNAETLDSAINQGDSNAKEIWEFFVKSLIATRTCLLVTSRHRLLWPSAQYVRLSGLSPAEGAKVFEQNCNSFEQMKYVDSNDKLVSTLSDKVGGHPLSLVLLGRAFEINTQNFAKFVETTFIKLKEAEDLYQYNDHQTLFACINQSVNLLTEAEKNLLSTMWVFDAPFLLQLPYQLLGNTIEQISQNFINFFADAEKTYNKLVRLGILEHQASDFEHENADLFSLPTPIRFFARHYLPQAASEELLLQRFTEAYAIWTTGIGLEIWHKPIAGYISQHSLPDMQRVTPMLDAPQQITHLLHLNWIAYGLGDVTSALDYLSQATRISEQTANKEMDSVITTTLVGIYAAAGMFRQVDLVSRRSAQDNETTLESALLTQNMMLYYQNFGQTHYILKLLLESLFKIRSTVSNKYTKYAEASVLTNIGYLYVCLAQHEKAIQFFKDAQALQKTIAMPHGQVITLLDLGRVFMNMGETRKAVEVLEEALNLVEELSAKHIKASILHNLGEVYKLLRKEGIALDYYENSLALSRDLGLNQLTVTTLSQLCLMQGFYLRNLDKAQLLLTELEKDISVHNALPYSVIATALNSMGQLQRLLGRFVEARQNFEQALEYTRLTHVVGGQVAVLVNIAFLYYIDFSNSEQAIDYVKEALKLMQSKDIMVLEGAITIQMLQNMLEQMTTGKTIKEYNGDKFQTGYSTKGIQRFIGEVVYTMFISKVERETYRNDLVQRCVALRHTGYVNDAELLDCVINIFDGLTNISLPSGHFHEMTLQKIQQHIKKGNNSWAGKLSKFILKLRGEE